MRWQVAMILIMTVLVGAALTRIGTSKVVAGKVQGLKRKKLWRQCYCPAAQETQIKGVEVP